MTTFYGYKKLRAAEDWRGLAGDEKWVQGRSAYELAHCWSRHGGMPRAILDALDASGHGALRALAVDMCLVEKPVHLDSRTGPSMTDLMAYGRNAGGDTVVIAVEGKADEPFGSRVSKWIRGDSKEVPAPEPRATRTRRLAFLCKHLATTIPGDSPLRYQLLHRTVSAVLEAQLHGAVAALVLVHAFGPDSPENQEDFNDFLVSLGHLRTANAKHTVLGPFMLGELGDLPTYFLWWQDAVDGDHATVQMRNQPPALR